MLVTNFARASALSGLLLAASAGAQAPDRRLGAPPTVDAAPTGFGCTVDTLVSGESCLFEGDAEAAPPGGADRSPKELADRICTAAARPLGEARPDAGVKAACQAEVVARLRVCALAEAVLLDGSGRFLPSARACYASMGDALAGAHTQAASASPCCRCLSEHRCTASRACLEEGPAAALSSAGRACAERACAQACGAFLPPSESAEAAPRPPAAKPTSPIPGVQSPASATKDI